MKNLEIELPIFGKIQLQEDWEHEFFLNKWGYNFNEMPIDLDVNFEMLPDEDSITKLSVLLNQLNIIHEIGKNILQKDFEEGQEVKNYLTEWHEDIFGQVFNDIDYQAFIEKTDQTKGIHERLLSLIRLVRIGIYHNLELESIVLDFAFGYDKRFKFGFREHMLVVKLNADFTLNELCTEG